MGAYDGMAEEVVQALAEFGRAAILRRAAPGVVDPVAGTTGTEVVTDYPCNALEDKYSIKDIDGTRIQQGDKKILLSAPTTMPLPSLEDSLVLGSEVYSIINVDPLAPDGNALMYTIQARR